MAFDSALGFIFYHVLPSLLENWWRILILLAAGLGLIIFRERILLALTGDRKLHGDVLSMMKSFLGFCCCSFGWRTWCFPCVSFFHCTDLILSQLCCRVHTADHCQTAVVSCQGAIQRYLGLNPRTLIISDVVVGDLPLEEDGDFFFSIDCGVSPEQRSSVEESNGYAIQFADTMLCKVRLSVFEEPVHVIVWRLHFLSPSKLCEVHLSPSVMFELTEKKNWRIAMHPSDPLAPHKAHPWISFQVQETNDYHALTPRQELRSEAAGFAPLWCSPRNASLNLSASHLDYERFKKERSQLFDRELHLMHEPEADGLDHRCLKSRWAKRACHGALLILMLLIFPRMYMMSCYHQYEWVTVVQEVVKNNASFPVAAHDIGHWHDGVWTNPELFAFWKRCQEDLLGVDSSTISRLDSYLRYCVPSGHEVEETCETELIKGIMRPRAFKDAVDLLESSGGLGKTLVRQVRKLDHLVHSFSPQQYLFSGGLPCSCGVVRWRNHLLLGLISFDALLDLLVASLVSAIFILRCCCMREEIRNSWQLET